MGLKKKVKSLIKDDRPAKLKSLLSSQDVDPSDIRFSGGRNVLHYCALVGSADMMRCLLRLECDPMTPDREGRLPLHTALYRCLDQRADMASQTYKEMVTLLVRLCPMSLDIEDKDGATCHDLLQRVKARLKSDQMRGEGMLGNSSVEDEREWRQKLASESQFEFEEQEPHNGYIEDYSDREEPESFSSWTDRLHQEYSQKRSGQDSRWLPSSSNQRKRRQFGPQGEETRKKCKTQPDPDEELKKAREKMRQNYKPPQVENVSSKASSDLLLSKKERYEKKFSLFFQSPPTRGSVTFAGVPWPCANMDKLTDILFCDLSEKSSEAYRKFLRKERVRWHPDKFLQKFGDFLHPNHVDKIMGRVKLISQTLNALVT